MTLSEVPGPDSRPDGVDVLALNEALNKLAALDPRQAQIVEMRFFCGMCQQEIAAAMDVSLRTVKRDWVTARAWLFAELRRPPGQAVSV